MKHGIGERVEAPAATASIDEHLLFARHEFAYDEAANFVVQKKVLEIGCGTAFGALKLSRHTQEFVAVDVDTHLIESLKREKESGKFFDHVSFLAYDGKRLPFADGHFSVILSFQVIEHVADDILFLNELARVLSKDGVILITTPNRLIRLLPGQKPFNNFHTREYSPDDFRHMVKKANLNLRLFGVFGDDHTQGLELQRLKKYHSHAYRHLFQNLPKSIQQWIKQVYLKRKKNGRSQPLLRPMQFLRSPENLNQAIDLWAELRKNANVPG